MKVCVYCASSAQINQAFFDATIAVAKSFVDQNISVVFGGGSSGLMGQLADTMIDNGGNIKGIMPKFMNEVEWAHKRVVEFEFTDTMHERKAKFLEGIDGIVTLAGGTGTLEELFEVITLKRLGLFTKPIVILNTNGYYDPIKLMLDRSVEERFMSERHLEMWTFVEQPEDVIPALYNAPTWDKDALSFANIR
jgi:uncharacterized protein (TIGR00730 family)